MELRIIGFVSLALLITCGTAQPQAAQWVSVGKTTNEKLEAFVDLGSIRISGYVHSASFKYVYAAHSQKDERANKWYKVSFDQETFNCADKTSRVEALSVSYEDGTTWSEPAAMLPSSWTLIGPDTLRDYERRYICAFVPK
jgi:hypothetical protein